MGESAPDLSLTILALAMFILTVMPVIRGMALRQFAPVFADRVESKLLNLASVLFVLIILAAIASRWELLLNNVALLGLALLTLNLSTMMGGLLIAGALA
ncbi:hypothetical protein [Yoonia sp. I 8.24]|uniref:hypothetical protein n=1 Tax=Yoonia sp. I 8.24 TaxID=1537229 RepID=UPI001EDFC7D7|nr:hypothetical protein [Yoonia sp. I 8.24]MCG3268816.1 hypothetical protein [Yoonia sp. I 8.24]